MRQGGAECGPSVLHGTTSLPRKVSGVGTLRVEIIPSLRRGAGSMRWHISGSSSRPQMSVFLGIPIVGGMRHPRSSTFHQSLCFHQPLDQTDGRRGSSPDKGGWERSARLMSIWRIHLGAYDQTSCRRTVRGGHFQGDLMAVSSAWKCIR